MSGTVFEKDSIIGNRYRVVRWIADGFLGGIYEVEAVDFGQRVALKIVQEDRLQTAQARADLHRRILLSLKITHPNVCRIFDVGNHDQLSGEKLPFFTMELLQGETLLHYIGRRGPLTSMKSLPLIDQLTSALEAIHTKGLVHGNLNPANVMLVAEIEGLRSVITNYSFTEKIWAAPDPAFDAAQIVANYRCPKDKDRVSATVDIYALGAIIFFILTGRHPRSLERDADARPLELRKFAPGLPKDWEEALQTCMDPHSRNRYASPLSVHQALTTRKSLHSPINPNRSLFQWLGLGILVTVLFLFAWWQISKEGPAPRPLFLEISEPTQITSDAGLEIDPQFGPDGQSVVFASDRSGFFEIYEQSVLEPDRFHQLTSDGGQNIQPTLSPDGKTLAYHSLVRGGIWLLPMGAGSSTQLNPFGANPSWSPGGQTLVFQDFSRTEVAERSIPAFAPSALWLKSIIGGDPQPLTQVNEPEGAHGEPVWSPSGRHVAFSSGNRRFSKIWCIDVQTKALTLIAGEARINLHPEFSSDGHTLFFVSSSSEGRGAANLGLWKIALDSGTCRPNGSASLITDPSGTSLRQFTLSPLSPLVVYGTLETKSQIWSLPLDPSGQKTGNPTTLISGNLRASRPVYSPDGRYLAYDRWLRGNNLDIWLMDLQTTRSKRISRSSDWDTLASWMSNDQLAFLTNRTSPPRSLWTVDVHQGGEEPLVDLEAETAWARLSPSGEEVVYHEHDQQGILQIFSKSLEGGIPRQLTQDPEMAGFGIISPDGAWLAYESRRNTSTHIMVQPTDGSAEPVQITLKTGDAWPFSWSPDSERIAYAARWDGFWNLYWIRRDGTEIVQLTEYQAPNLYVRYPAWSPIGDQMAYELSRTVGDLWVSNLGGSKGIGD